MSKSTTGKIAQQLRKIPGVAHLEGELKGAVAEAGDMPIAGYDDRTAAEITDRFELLAARSRQDRRL